MSLPVHIHRNRVEIGERFALSFQRTLRIPDDGKVYPLPPSLGEFPVHAIRDYRSSLPSGWGEKEGVFIPMYQREAMWLAFEAAAWKPNAVKIGVGRLNALTGETWDEALHSKPQDYLVCPEQPWLDGMISKEGIIRQFVAMPLGMGYTIEGQVTGEESYGGVQVLVFDPKPGIFPDQSPPEQTWGDKSRFGEVLGFASEAPVQQMGLGAGGQIAQKIYPDPYGIQTWEASQPGRLDVKIVNSLQYEAITGQPAPHSPVSARTYSEYGLPWFELYDEEKGSLTAPPKLAGVESIDRIDAKKGFTDQEDMASTEIKPEQIKKLRRKRGARGRAPDP